MSDLGINSAGVSGPLGYMNSSQTDIMKQRTTSETTSGTSGSNILLTSSTQDIPLPILAGHIGFYEAPPGRPSLAPLGKLRTAEEQEEAKNTPQEIYNAFKKKLPPNLRALLEEDKKKPQEERDPTLIAFDNALLFGANVLSILQNAGNKEVKQENDSQILDEWTKGRKQIGGEILSKIKQFIENQGANTRHYDEMVQLISELNSAQTKLNKKEE